MDNPKNQISERIKEASNVLVTVSTNPTVDQLAAAIGLTLLLGKLKKHATTVFSGAIPPAIDFLKPENTIEKTTDSLQDFIIALDKNKADKIRYKVEDTMVKIFITPYRSSITGDDLQFSKGDFNVDVVLALGVHKQEELDQAITSHGRILHDASVVTINLTEGAELGTMNWNEPKASSLCEMIVELSGLLQADALDEQIATALLTGIVAETDRFSNQKTTSVTMSASAKLMAAGANQQLVSQELKTEKAAPETNDVKDADPKVDNAVPEDEVDADGSLHITHDASTETPAAPEVQAADTSAETMPEPAQEAAERPAEPPTVPESAPEPPVQEAYEEPPAKLDAAPAATPEISLPEPQVSHDTRAFLTHPPTSQQGGDVFSEPRQSAPDDVPEAANSHLIMEPPAFGGKLSASADDSALATNPLDIGGSATPILSHKSADTAEKSEPQAVIPEPQVSTSATSTSQPPVTGSTPVTAPPSIPPPLSSSNLAQAAEPPRLTIPTPTPSEVPPAPALPFEPFIKPAAPGLPSVAMPVSDLAPPTPPAGSVPVDVTPTPAEMLPPPVPAPAQAPALPQAVIDLMDNQRLNQIEKAVGSPHQTQAAQEFQGRTLDDIERAVDGHHINPTQHVARTFSDQTLDAIEARTGSPHKAFESLLASKPELEPEAALVDAPQPEEPLAPVADEPLEETDPGVLDDLAAEEAQAKTETSVLVPPTFDDLPVRKDGMPLAYEAHESEPPENLGASLDELWDDDLPEDEPEDEPNTSDEQSADALEVDDHSDADVPQPTESSMSEAEAVLAADEALPETTPVASSINVAPSHPLDTHDQLDSQVDTVSPPVAETQAVPGALDTHVQPVAQEPLEAPVPTLPDLPDPSAARQAVNQAINLHGDGRTSDPPLQSIGSHDLGPPLHTDEGQQGDIHIDDEGTLHHLDKDHQTQAA